MPEFTRRRALAVLGSAAAGVGGYWYLTDDCPDRREPAWTVSGRHWSPPASTEYSTVVSESYGATGPDHVARIASVRDYDGSPDWVRTEVGGGAGVPAVAEGTVYVGTGRDRVYALDARTGHVEWRYDAEGAENYGGGAWGRPAVTEGRVVVGISHSDAVGADPGDSDAFTHRVVCLDADSGEAVWERSVDAQVWAGPVAVGDAVVAATDAGSVHCFGTGDGERRWRAEVGTQVRRRLFAADGRVHVASEDGRVSALDAASGEEEWTASVPGEARTVEESDGSLLVGDSDGTVVALARDTGREDWRVRADASMAAVSADESLAYALDQRGVVHVLDPSAGERRRRFRVAETGSEDGCGWNPEWERANGLLADDGWLTVTGPWVGHVRDPSN